MPTNIIASNKTAPPFHLDKTTPTTFDQKLPWHTSHVFAECQLLLDMSRTSCIDDIPFYFNQRFKFHRDLPSTRDEQLTLRRRGSSRLKGSIEPQAIDKVDAVHIDSMVSSLSTPDELLTLRSIATPFAKNRVSSFLC